MPAFSSSTAFNEANGFPREFGNWSFDQYQQALAQANNSRDLGNWATNWGLNYNLDRANNGYTSPTDLRNRGNEIMPVDPTIQARGDRLNRISDLNAGRTPASQTMGNVYDRLNGQAEDIGRTGQMTQDELDALYSRTSGRNDTANRDFENNLTDTYGTAQRNVNSEFGALRGGNSRLTDNITSATSGTMGRLRGANNANADDLFGSSQGTFRDLAANRDSTYGGVRRNLNDTVSGMEGRSGRTYGGVRNDLNSTVSGLEGGSNRTYGDLQGGSDQTYNRLTGAREGTFDTLQGGADTAYGDAISSAEALKPQGDALAARMGRQFAPAVANVKQRLRTAGVGPNDLQSISALSDIEAKRAAAMDDAQASEMGSYTDRLNSLRVGQQTNRQNLGLGNLDRNIGLGQDEQAGRERLQLGRQGAAERLGMTRYNEGRDLALGENTDSQNLATMRYGQGRDLDLSQLTDTERQDMNREQQRQDIQNRRFDNEAQLSTAELDRNTGAAERGFGRETDLATGAVDRSNRLGLEQGGEYRTNVLRNSEAQRQADQQRTAGTLSNLDTQFGRTQDWRNAGTQADLLGRNLERDDFNTNADLLREQNQNDLTNLDLRNSSYDRGRQWTADDMSTRDAAAGNVTQYGTREQARQLDLSRLGQGFGTQAQTSYNQARTNTQGDGNWGTRLIGGIASAGLNMLAPGAGTAFGGVYGSATGTGTQGTYGSGQGGGGSPYSFSWLTPQLQNTQANAAATQAGYNRGQTSTAQVAPGQWTSQYPQWAY